MTRRSLAVLVLLGVALPLGGCRQIRQNQQDILNLQSTSRAKFDLMKRQNEFLNRKVNQLTEKVDELTDTNERLSADLAAYAARPEEIKLEIVSEVNTIRQAMATSQRDFQEKVETTFAERTEALDSHIAEELTKIKKTLNKHTSFVQFVATEQDSINRVFARRFDSRPWYQSIIGKWEDRERAALASP